MKWNGIVKIKKLKVGKLKYLKMEMLYCKGNREKK
jgi:hypothetical protein